ncbi:MAG: hypothetical protein QME41_08390 [Actinomycetota bacterium]|nr:hypothetical protein [Actinomycetota bacterium]
MREITFKPNPLFICLLVLVIGYSALSYWGLAAENKRLRAEVTELRYGGVGEERPYEELMAEIDEETDQIIEDIRESEP